MTTVFDYLRNSSLTFRIVSGLLLGVFTGLFFGEEAAGLQIVGSHK